MHEAHVEGLICVSGVLLQAFSITDIERKYIIHTEGFDETYRTKETELILIFFLNWFCVTYL